MSKFKEGDVVTCIDNQYLEEEIELGTNYTISGLIGDSLYLDQIPMLTFNQCRFEYPRYEFKGKHPTWEVTMPQPFERVPPQATKFNTSGSKYLRDIQTTIEGKIDVYAVLIAFNVVSPARQHAIKKLLCAGIRGKNNELNDIQEAKDAIERDIQLLNN